MLWIILGISAYFFLAVNSVVDKYLLKTSLPNPRVYAFLVGVLGIIGIFLLPFGNLKEISFIFLLSGIVAGIFRILGLFWYYKGVKNFELSRIAPAVGAFLPIFSLFFSWLANLDEKLILTKKELASFFFLVLGGVLIVLEKNKKITIDSLKISLFSSFLLGISFFLSKLTYLKTSFLAGIGLILLGSFFCSFLFLFSKNIKKELTITKQTKRKKTALLFLINQAIGGTGTLLQYLAVYLVPFSLLAFVNALEATKYVFILFLSIKYFETLKEEFSKKVLVQKILAIILIFFGIFFL